MAELLDVAAAVHTPSGWVELEDEANGYELHAESFTSRAVQQRTVNSPGEWISGTFARRSTKENVTEPVSILVDGAGSHFAYATRMKVLRDAFDQTSYTFRVRFGDVLETWVCTMPADYTESCEQPFRFATTGILRVQVAHLPDVTIVEVTP